MHTGLGSKSSPIFISDDEEDAYPHDIEILSPSANNGSKSSLVLQYQGSVTRSQKSSRNTNKVIKLPAVVETSSKKRKRKHDHSVTPVHLPAGPAGSHKNKKAKQERFTHLHLDRDSHFELDYGSYTPMRSDHHTSSNHHSIENITAPPAHYISPTHDHDDNDDGDLSLLSSSEWVNSMARAAEPSEDMTYSSWKPPPKYGSPPPQGYPLEEFDSVSEPFPSTSTSTTLSNATSTNNSVQQPPPSVSPAKKIIGMPIEKDGDGKRGAFKLTPSTTFEGSPGVTFPHVPISQNTLIVEQLPKTCRTSTFIRLWCEKACGSYPVFFAIDPSSAKALVEFPSATLAKKAWGSPKLGKELSGLSSVALKGKPREDLIRVWWLTQALTFERKELEEGEIEDEPTVEDTPSKETKKERKARLAKQLKEEKARKREKAFAAAAVLQKEKSARSQAQAQVEAEAARASSSASAPNPFPGEFFMLPSVIGMHMSYPPNHIPPPVPDYWNVPGVMPSFLPPMPTSLPPPLPPPPESQAQWDNWNTPLHDNSHTDPNHLPDPYDVDYPDDDRMEVEDVDMELSSPVVTTHSIPSHPHANVYKIDSPSTSTSVTKDSTSDPHVSRTSSHSSDSHRGLPTPTPTPPNEGSGSGSVTKPLGDSHIPAAFSVPAAPSEPRAMKNAPREPSFTKRSLLARQKELEERILRTKLELGRKGQQVAKPISTSTSTSTSSQSGTIPPSPVAPIINEGTNTSDVSSDKRELEQNLRQLVLASQKRRKAAAPDSSGTSTPTVAIIRPVDADSSSIAPVTSTSTSDSPAPPVQPTLSATKSSLDDMALSFLNETIQTLQPVSAHSVSISVSTRPGTPTTAPPSQQGLKAVPPSTTLQPTSVNPPSNQSSLAAKRLQLEQNITETKQLMDKLSKATTKQERDSIFARIREISRNSQDHKDSAPSTPAPVPYPAFLTAHVKSPWPDSIVGGGILILSDDEDEEDDA